LKNKKTTHLTIAFIGAGKMAEAVVHGLGAFGNIIISDVDPKRLRYFKNKYAVSVADDNRAAFAAAEIVLLCVKPQHMQAVLDELAAESVSRKPKLLISIAAGIPLSYLEKKMAGFPVIRAMPNNPCLVGKGMVALAKGKLVRTKEAEKARQIFSAVGEVIDVPEKWMDAVTALSGSGPAFIYLAIEALTKAGMAVGLPKEIAALLSAQLVLGAAETVKITGKDPIELKRMVSSPKGTTVEGLKVLDEHKFEHALQRAVLAAAKRSKALSKEIMQSAC
jgi:pyrroline-5-carboxylate reductase